MLDAGTIRDFAREAARHAAQVGLEPHPITRSELAEARASLARRVPPPVLRRFPNLGDYRPAGWRLEEELFVDSSGIDLFNAGGPALSIAELVDRLQVGHAYALTETGEFQVYIGDFAPDRRRKGNAADFPPEDEDELPEDEDEASDEPQDLIGAARFAGAPEPDFLTEVIAQLEALGATVELIPLSRAPYGAGAPAPVALIATRHAPTAEPGHAEPRPTDPDSFHLHTDEHGEPSPCSDAAPCWNCRHLAECERLLADWDSTYEADRPTQEDT